MSFSGQVKSELCRTVPAQRCCALAQCFGILLYSAGVPDPELIIRPSGEKRTSNFLLWQSAYSEYVFQDVLWPDYSPRDLDAAIAEFHRRNRRFGGA